MINVLLLGGPADGQRREVHGVMRSCYAGPDDKMALYQVVALCSHGDVKWFGVLDGADPLALLIAGYAPALPKPRFDPVLIDLAAFDDTRANSHLDATGSFAWFDEPEAVRAARAALQAQGYRP